MDDHRYPGAEERANDRTHRHIQAARGVDADHERVEAPAFRPLHSFGEVVGNWRGDGRGNRGRQHAGPGLLRRSLPCKEDEGTEGPTQSTAS